VTEPPDVDAWQAWHPSEAAVVLAGTDVPWAVAGGWAIDLHLGRQTRPHSDLEVAIPNGLFPRFRRELTAFDLYEALDGGVRKLGPEEFPQDHQVWALDPLVRKWRMDTFLEPGDERTWVSHRDERLTLPMAEVVRRTRDGIPYQAPAAVLLAKAKHTRPKDEADFSNTVPTLSAAEKRWLRDAIAQVHPGHRWLGEIGG
jgi:hypothetical protein